MPSPAPSSQVTLSPELDEVRSPRLVTGLGRRLAYRLLRYSPLQLLSQWQAADKLAVLAYHEVPDAERFAAQLDFLRKRARPVSLEELLASQRRGRSLPRRSVLITFDDAGRTHLETALPLLRERGVPAVVFVVTAVLDSEQPFWFDEVAELVKRGVTVPELAGLSPDQAVAHLTMVPDEVRRAIMATLRAAARGWTPAAHGLPATTLSRPQLRSEELPLFESAGVAVGNHTRSHACLDRCDQGTMHEEVFAAHERLTSILGHEPLAFAYPGGFYDAQALATVAEAGYELAFAYDDRLSPWPPTQPLATSRLRGNAYDSLDRLALTFSGLHGAAWRLFRGRARPRQSTPAAFRRTPLL